MKRRKINEKEAGNTHFNNSKSWRILINFVVSNFTDFIFFSFVRKFRITKRHFSNFLKFYKSQASICTFYSKNGRLQWDSNSDGRKRRPPRWPLTHCRTTVAVFHILATVNNEPSRVFRIPVLLKRSVTRCWSKK